MYRIKAPHKDNPNLVTLVDGEPVGLNGSIRVKVQPTKLRPGFDKTIRQATQAELERLFKDGNPLIEHIPTRAKIPKKKK